MSYTFRYPKDKYFINGGPDKENLAFPEIEPKDLKGFFKARPSGLHLDADTGVIDINKSHTGIKYVITFTPCTDEPASTFSLIISGVDYVDNVHYLSDKSDDMIIHPFFDADVNNRKIPATLYDIPDNKKLTASYFKLAINKQTGEIDLRRTIHNCALGIGKFGFNIRPANGASKDFSINYQHQEGEAMAVNNISLRLHYFATAADVPDYLLKRLNDNRRYLGLPIIVLPGRPPRRDALNIYMDGETRRPPHEVIIGR